jgi:hypothetical protein
VGALIALIASVCYTATWEVIYFGGFMPNFIESYQEMVIASARAKGASPAELEQKAAEMKRFAETYQNPVVNVGMTLVEPLPLGLVIALVSAGILSRRRRDGDDAVAFAQPVQ